MRRGLGPVGMALVSAWPFAQSRANVPAAWIEQTGKMALGVLEGTAMDRAASTQVAILTRGVLNSMLLGKFKSRIAAALVLMAVVGLGTWFSVTLAAQSSLEAERLQGEPADGTKPAVAESDGSGKLNSQETFGKRFHLWPTEIVGGSGNTVELAVSADGKRIASIGGPSPPFPLFFYPPAFVSVTDTASKKELLSLQMVRKPVSVGISPDGRFVAFTGESSELRLLEVESGRALWSKMLDGRGYLAFASDGKSLATATEARTVQIWDVASGKERAKFNVATRVTCIAFSQDGQKIAAAGEQRTGEGDDGIIVYVWDVATQRLLHQLESKTVGRIVRIAFSPDAAQVAASSDRQARIWGLADAKVKAEVSVQQPFVGLAFSSAGVLAGAMGDGSIRLWSADSGKETGLLNGHVGACRCLAFTRDGDRLVSGGSARSLKVWDVAGKKEIATVRQDERPADLPAPLALAATRDGSLLALATEEQGVILRDGRTGAITATLKGHDDAITCVAFSPDGKTLATGSADRTIKLWDVAAGNERATLQGHRNWVYAIAFSPDGKTFASGAYDKSLRLWDAGSGKEIGMVEAHRASVRAIAFSDDGKSVASGGADGFVKAWDLPKLELRFAQKGHAGTVRSLAFSPDNKTLASGGEDGLVRFWHRQDGKELVIAKKEHKAEVTALAFVDESVLLSGSDGFIYQWDAATGRKLGDLFGPKGGVSGIVVAGGGKEFFSTGADRVVLRYRRDLSGPAPVRRFVGHTGAVSCSIFSPDGQRIASCGHWTDDDKSLRVWDAQSGAELWKVELPEVAMWAVYSPDGKYVAASSKDSKSYLFDAATGKEIRSFTGHTATVQGIDFNADGSRLITSGWDNTARVWETATGREIQKFTGHSALVRRAIFHPDGKHALSSSQDGYVRMWEIDTAKEVKRFKPTFQFPQSMAISRDGKLLAAGSQIIDVFEIGSGKLVTSFRGHQNGALHITFSGDGKRIISCGSDRTARLWSSETGKELYRFGGQSEYMRSANFSPDGKWLLTSGGGTGYNNNKNNQDKGTDHDIRLWRMPDERELAEFKPED